MAEAVAAHAWAAPAYSYAINRISDLGALECAKFPAESPTFVCSPLRALMNASFVLQGFLIAGGAVLVSGRCANSRTARMALFLIGIAGAGVAVVGLVPEDRNMLAHVAGAAANFLAGNAGLIVLGAALARARSARAGGVITIAFGISGLVGCALIVSAHRWGLQTGEVERLAAYPLPMWLSLTGAILATRAWRQ